MGSGKRTQLWLLAFLAFSSLAYVSPSKVMSAPSILRVGTEENIFVECQDCTETERVTISVFSHQNKGKRLAITTVDLTVENNFQALCSITIPPKDFSRDPGMKQYVYLRAEFTGVELEKVVLVSFQSGYIFIQTDKTLYTPNSKVHYRIFAMTPSMEPLEKKDEAIIDSTVITELMNPDGIILPLGQVSLKLGIYSGNYQLGEMVSPGLWKIVVKFLSNPQQSYSAEFEVKEYVLPSFEVKLSSVTSFFHVDSQDLTIKIKATYLFGEPVDGTAYVVFGIMYQGQKKSFPSSLQRVPFNEGEGQVKLMREHITDTYSKIEELVGSSIYVAASVLTSSGSEMVEAELRGIQIVTSPYTIHFKKTPKYYKPGMTFDVMIEVMKPDGTPAPSIDVLLEPGNVQGHTKANGMARLSINTDETVIEPLTITAKTDVPHVTQASANMTALPYTTKSNSYMYIGVDTSEVALNHNLKFSVILNKDQDAQKHITYLILSRGQLVQYGRQEARGLTSMIVVINKNMLPSFRIIAYYFTVDNEVVSDSVWVDVTDSCMGSLKLEPSRTTSVYLPGKTFRLKVTGDPGATVGLVAVDKGVYVLNNKHRLTQKKVWDLVETHDTGCTPGGGKDGIGVFYDAGLLFESNVALGTPYRLEQKCSAPSRRKRASTIMQVRTTLVSQYDDQLQRDCCLEGMMDTQLSYDCQRRSEYIMDNPVCVEAFLDCCKKLEIPQAERRHEILLLARSEEDDSYLDSNEINSRSNFPESWLWLDVTLPACSLPNCKTINETQFPLKDSITTWQFTGISLSRTHGICVSDPLEVIVRKDFFIDLRLPYSAVRGEQIEVKVILHNYTPDSVYVHVDLIETKHVCSAAYKRQKYRKEVTVEGETTLAIPYIIIPMKDGKYPIDVKAVIRELQLSDGVRKDLLVVPEGILKKSLKTITLDPVRKGVDGKQEVIINSKIQTKDLVPNSRTITQISVTGREQISALVENAISGRSMGSLIIQPTGCGEQNMIYMTLPLIATTYLDKTYQWEKVGFERRKEAVEHIRTGYLNELHYRKQDGSFSTFTDNKSSTWLTAYVAKVFAMANSLMAVSEEHICEAINFLISNTQQSDGSFKEVGSIVHGEMIGDVLGKDSNVSMTAFCLIAIQESRTLCSKYIPNLTMIINKSVAYLQRHLDTLTNSYAAAMTSYALANENKLDRRILSKFISSDLTHWSVRDSDLFTLEATAYALLALVKAKAFDNAKPVVRWFNQQQTDGGGFGSTQATIMVYQAIAEYWISANEEKYDVNVDIGIPGRQIPQRFNFNRENHYTTRTSKFNKINQNVKLTATGAGEATVKMVSLYYIRPKNTESDCQKFNLSVQLIPEETIEKEKTYRLKIHVLYKDKKRDATMSVLDIGLLTGFRINTEDLKRLSKGHARTISKYETNRALTEKGSLFIYLQKVSHKQTEEIAFRIHQTLEVGILQPAAVSVYEYYDYQHLNQTICTKFYHPVRKHGELLKLCTNNECTCAEENCSLQKTEKISNDMRTAKACETKTDGSIDFVYRVRLEQFAEELSTDIYTMRVVEVIKGGSFDECQEKPDGSQTVCDVGPLGNLRPFLSYQHCRGTLNLKIGKTYLIMGMAKDIHKNEEKASYQYVLGERTWIEYWPTNEECQTLEYRPTCVGMETMQQLYTQFGCQQ